MVERIDTPFFGDKYPLFKYVSWYNKRSVLHFNRVFALSFRARIPVDWNYCTKGSFDLGAHICPRS